VIRLPKAFPKLSFRIEHPASVPHRALAAADRGAA
jgi:hypothetical protein